ncbi:MAG: hypothetical protein RLO12_14270, partial [Fulvivirga sp.]
FKNKVYVSSRQVVQVFDLNGVFLKNIETGNQCYDIKNDGENLYLGCGSYILKTDEDFKVLEKIGEGLLDTSTSIALDDEGNIYSTSIYDRKIKIFKPN